MSEDIRRYAVCHGGDHSKKSVFWVFSSESIKHKKSGHFVFVDVYLLRNILYLILFDHWTVRPCETPILSHRHVRQSCLVQSRKASRVSACFRCSGMAMFMEYQQQLNLSWRSYPAPSKSPPSVENPCLVANGSGMVQRLAVMEPFIASLQTLLAAFVGEWKPNLKLPSVLGRHPFRGLCKQWHEYTWQ